ncbi:MAG: hypothetical protein ACM3ZC_16730 [Bacteroidota bacterium]
MNCHGNNRDESGTNRHGKHGSWMMLLCALPLVLVGGALLFGYRSSLLSLGFLLCPLIHLGMMAWMFLGRRKETHDD